MNRVQKSIWNPFLTHSKPSDIAVVAWLIFLFLSELGWLEDSNNFAFCLGLVVGLSFMQIGFNWGQYQAMWFRFFLQNRETIFEHGYSNKRRALIFLLAFVTSKMLRLVISIGLLFVLLALFDFLFPFSRGFSDLILSLLVASLVAAPLAHALTKRAEAWGDAKLNELSDYSYVFDADQEKKIEQK